MSDKIRYERFISQDLEGFIFDGTTIDPKEALRREHERRAAVHHDSFERVSDVKTRFDYSEDQERDAHGRFAGGGLGLEKGVGGGDAIKEEASGRGKDLATAEKALADKADRWEEMYAAVREMRTDPALMQLHEDRRQAVDDLQRTTAEYDKLGPGAENHHARFEGMQAMAEAREIIEKADKAIEASPYMTAMKFVAAPSAALTTPGAVKLQALPERVRDLIKHEAERQSLKDDIEKLKGPTGPHAKGIAEDKAAKVSAEDAAFKTKLVDPGGHYAGDGEARTTQFGARDPSTGWMGKNPEVVASLTEKLDKEFHPNAIPQTGFLNEEKPDMGIVTSSPRIAINTGVQQIIAETQGGLAPKWDVTGLCVAHVGFGASAAFAPTTGTVTLNHQTAQEAREMLVQLKEHPDKMPHDVTVNAFKAIVHENIHATSPMDFKHYKGSGAALEEVTTEILARDTMHQMIPESASMPGLTMPFTKEQGNGQGSYQSTIYTTYKTTQDALGRQGVKVDMPTTAKIVREASLAYRLRKPTEPFTADKAVEAFARDVSIRAGLSDADYEKHQAFVSDFPEGFHTAFGGGPTHNVDRLDVAVRTVWDLERNDTSGALALVRAGGLTSSDVRTIVMLHDDQEKIIAALRKLEKEVGPSVVKLDAIDIFETVSDVMTRFDCYGYVNPSPNEKIQ